MLGLPGHAGATAGVSQQIQVDPQGPLQQSRLPMKHGYVANVVMLAELTVKQDMLDAFLDYTVANLAISRSYPGNLAFDILIDEARPNQVIFYEVWESVKAQQDYMAWRVQAGDLTKLRSFLASEAKFKPLRCIAP